MPFKVRGRFINTGNAKFGVNGTNLAKLIYGSACINQPSAVGHTVVVGASLAVTGVAATDKVFVTPTASLTEGMALLAACCVTGGISASWINAASVDASASANVAVSYLVLA